MNVSRIRIFFKCFNVVRNNLDVRACLLNSCFRHAAKEACVGICTAIILFRVHSILKVTIVGIQVRLFSFIILGRVYRMNLRIVSGDFVLLIP